MRGPAQPEHQLCEAAEPQRQNPLDSTRIKLHRSVSIIYRQLSSSMFKLSQQQESWCHAALRN